MGRRGHFKLGGLGENIVMFFQDIIEKSHRSAKSVMF